MDTEIEPIAFPKPPIIQNSDCTKVTSVQYLDDIVIFSSAPVQDKVHDSQAMREFALDTFLLTFEYATKTVNIFIKRSTFMKILNFYFTSQERNQFLTPINNKYRPLRYTGPVAIKLQEVLLLLGFLHAPEEQLEIVVIN